MTLPPPQAAPDALLVQVIADVNAVAGEFGRPAPYFERQGIDYQALVAAVQPRAHHVSAMVHRAMVDDTTGLVPTDALEIALAAELHRGIAYGLELARRRRT